MPYRFRIFFLLLILIPLLGSTSCNMFRKGPSKAVQENEERQEEQAEEQRAEYEKKKERHISIQTDETKERMKKMQNRSERYNYNKKKFFLVRWWEQLFRKKRRAPQPNGY